MRLRVVDFVGNPGGGVRFATQLVRALASNPNLRIELISHADALTKYASLLTNLPITLRDFPPTPQGVCFSLPDNITDDCDALWLPWLHRHLPPAQSNIPVIASLHDAILFDHAHLFRDLVPPEALDDERRALLAWFSSPATIATSAHATVQTLTRLFPTQPDRFNIIPIASEHSHMTAGPLKPEWSFAEKPFLLCPANICPHKNHETLFHAYAQWGQKHPLALTGHATHLHLCKWDRAIQLSNLAHELNIPLGMNLHTLGYLPDPDYYALLRRAWALVMPTLAEGGGSFPVAEALHLGIPVLCSDIPPVREQINRLDAAVLWFNPHDPSSLTQRLSELERDYGRYKSQAIAQTQTLRPRPWTTVANEYLNLFASSEHRQVTSNK